MAPGRHFSTAALAGVFVVAGCGCGTLKSSPPEKPLYSASPTEIYIPSENLRISKVAGKLHFQSIEEIGPAPDIQLWFVNEELGIKASVTIYQAPEGTVGPKVILDKQGKPKLDGSDNPYAVFELSEPSETFSAEFKRVISGIEEHFHLKCTNKDGQPARMLAVPEDMKNSPVAWVAYFEGTGAFRDAKLKDVPWEWTFCLYVVGKHYVKIHTEGPSSPEMFGIETEVSRAITWLPTARTGAGAGRPASKTAEKAAVSADTPGTAAADKELADLRKRAEKGEAEAQFELSGLYVFGTDGVEQDYGEAAKWVRKAADQGLTAAQRALGIYYVRGLGVPKDEAEALKWLRKAADQGDGPAKRELRELGK